MIAQIVRQPDALLETINAYRAAWSAFISIRDDHEALQIVHLWQTPLKTLQAWDRPASTRESALAAIRFALEMYEKGDAPVIPAMMQAALGYFERAAYSDNSSHQSYAESEVWTPIADIVDRVAREAVEGSAR